MGSYSPFCGRQLLALACRNLCARTLLWRSLVSTRGRLTPSIHRLSQPHRSLPESWNRSWSQSLPQKQLVFKRSLVYFNPANMQYRKKITWMGVSNLMGVPNHHFLTLGFFQKKSRVRKWWFKKGLKPPLILKPPLKRNLFIVCSAVCSL